MDDRKYYVYILTNYTNTTLYIGVTGNINRRMYEHKTELIEGFTQKYHVTKLVYVEECSDVNDAIAREKQLKKWRREKKENLINSVNPEWRDLLKNEEDFSAPRQAASVEMTSGRAK